MKELVMNTVKTLGEKTYGSVYISEVGRAMKLSPSQLLPTIDALRKDWLVSGSALEGRHGVTAEQLSYQTSDGCGIVTLR